MNKPNTIPIIFLCDVIDSEVRTFRELCKDIAEICDSGETENDLKHQWELA